MGAADDSSSGKPAYSFESYSSLLSGCAILFFFIVELIFEYVEHKTETFLDNKAFTGLIFALQRAKNEFAVLGFISFVLLLVEPYVLSICVAESTKKDLMDFAPRYSCEGGEGDSSSYGYDKYGASTSPYPKSPYGYYPPPYGDSGGYGRHLLAGGGPFEAVKCPSGRVALFDAGPLHEVHILIFFANATHILYSALVVGLALTRHFLLDTFELRCRLEMNLRARQERYLESVRQRLRSFGDGEDDGEDFAVDEDEEELEQLDELENIDKIRQTALDGAPGRSQFPPVQKSLSTGSNFSAKSVARSAYLDSTLDEPLTPAPGKTKKSVTFAGGMKDINGDVRDLFDAHTDLHAPKDGKLTPRPTQRRRASKADAAVATQALDDFAVKEYAEKLFELKAKSKVGQKSNRVLVSAKSIEKARNYRIDAVFVRIMLSIPAHLQLFKPLVHVFCKVHFTIKYWRKHLRRRIKHLVSDVDIMKNPIKFVLFFPLLVIRGFFFFSFSEYRDVRELALDTLVKNLADEGRTLATDHAEVDFSAYAKLCTEDYAAKLIGADYVFWPVVLLVVVTMGLDSRIPEIAIPVLSAVISLSLGTTICSVLTKMAHSSCSQDEVKEMFLYRKPKLLVRFLQIQMYLSSVSASMWLFQLYYYKRVFVSCDITRDNRLAFEMFKFVIFIGQLFHTGLIVLPMLSVMIQTTGAANPHFTRAMSKEEQIKIMHLYMHTMDAAPLEQRLEQQAEEGSTSVKTSKLKKRIRRLKASVRSHNKHFREKVVENQRYATIYHILMANHIARVNEMVYRIQRKWRSTLDRRSSHDTAPISPSGVENGKSADGEESERHSFDDATNVHHHIHIEVDDSPGTTLRSSSLYLKAIDGPRDHPSDYERE